MNRFEVGNHLTEHSKVVVDCRTCPNLMDQESHLRQSTLLEERKEDILQPFVFPHFCLIMQIRKSRRRWVSSSQRSFSLYRCMHRAFAGWSFERLVEWNVVGTSMMGPASLRTSYHGSWICLRWHILQIDMMSPCSCMNALSNRFRFWTATFSASRTIHPLRSWSCDCLISDGMFSSRTTPLVDGLIVTNNGNQHSEVSFS